MNKQPAVTTATRQKLLDAFWQLAKEQPISRITIRSITDLAGYHRGTFYEYFPDIYALIDQEEDRMLQEIKEINGPRLILSAPEQLLPTVIPFLEKNADQLCLMLSAPGFSFSAKLQPILYPFFLEQFRIQDSDTARNLFAFSLGGVTGCLTDMHRRGQTQRIPEMIPVLIRAAREGFLKALLDIADRDR